MQLVRRGRVKKRHPTSNGQAHKTAAALKHDVLVFKRVCSDPGESIVAHLRCRLVRVELDLEDVVHSCTPLLAALQVVCSQSAMEHGVQKNDVLVQSKIVKMSLPSARL